MPTDARIEHREEQKYIGIRTIMPMSDFAERVPGMTSEVLEWLAGHGVEPVGRPFLRYCVIDMPDRMDVALGVPIAAYPDTDGRFDRDLLPDGRYAVATYVGVDNGIAANKELMDWISARGERVEHQHSDSGDDFESRYETFLTDAELEPDRGAWETEIAMKLRD